MGELFGVAPVVFWLVLTIVLAVFELITMGLSTIWFAFGALVALLASLGGASIGFQFVLFLVVSILSLLLVRPFSLKYLNNRTAKTNIDALIGKKVIVSKDVDNLRGTGNAVIDGTTWNIRAVDDNVTFAAGETVVVNKVEGNRLLVDKEKL